MNLAVGQPFAVPRPFELSRVDAVLAAVATFAYAASTVKFLNRDPLGSDTGAQAFVEVALVGIALIAAAVPTLRRGAIFPHPTPPVVGFVIFAGLTMTSALFSYWLALSLVKSCLLLATVLTATLLCTWRSPRDILGYFYWSSLTMMVLGVCLKLVSPESLFQVADYSGRQRLVLLAWHPNALADLAALTLMVGRLLKRRPHWSCQLFLLGIVALTGARAVGIVLIVVLAAAAVWRNARSARAMSALGVGIAATAFIGWMVVAIQLPIEHIPFRSVLERFYGDYTVEEFASLNGRTEVWTQSAALLANTTFFGYGLDGARAVLMDDFEWAGHSHNAYFELLLAGGMPALVVFLITWGFAVVKSLQMNARERPLLLSIHAYIFLCGFTDPNLTALQCLPIFLIVCLDACVRSESRLLVGRRATSVRPATISAIRVH